MNRLVAVGLTVFALLLADAPPLSAGSDYWEDKAPDESGSSGSGTKGSRFRSKRARSRASAAAAGQGDDESGRKIWTETDSARVKSIYDDSGNLVYQKAWDKRSGKEVPAPKATRDSNVERARDVNLREPTESRPYRPRRGEDGDYEENRSDPRPRYKKHALHAYGPRPGRHPYEFSLHVGFWSNQLTGTIKGAGGVEGKLKADTRSTMQGDFHNAKTGFGYLQLHHTTPSTTSFVFKGTTYTAGATYQEDMSVFDAFYRFELYRSPDSWFDWLFGTKILASDTVISQGATQTKQTSTVPLPELGLIGQHSLLDNLKLRGFAKYAYAAVNGKSGAMIDAEAEISWTYPGDHEYAFLNQFSVGYKYTSLSFLTNKGAADEASGTLDHSGPYVKASAYF